MCIFVVLLGDYFTIPFSLSLSSDDSDPVCTQLRRGTTDNDRFGYSDRWCEAGIDKPTIPVPLVEGKGPSDSQFIQISMVDKTDDDSKEQLKGVHCRWQEAFVVQDRNKLKLIDLVQKFSNDNSSKHTVIRVYNAVEENVVYSLASTLIMGRKSIYIEEKNSFNSSTKDNFSDLFSSTKRSGAVGVLLWKPYIMMCCTIPAAELLAGVPFSKSDWKQVLLL